MRRTEKLRHLHIAGAFAMCAGLLAYVRLTTQAGDASTFWPAVQLGCAVAVGFFVIILVIVPATDALDRVAAWATLVAAGFVLVVTLVWAWFGPELVPPSGTSSRAPRPRSACSLRCSCSSSSCSAS